MAEIVPGPEQKSLPPEPTQFLPEAGAALYDATPQHRSLSEKNPCNCNMIFKKNKVTLARLFILKQV
jgi:hypothetical protein